MLSADSRSDVFSVFSLSLLGSGPASFPTQGAIVLFVRVCDFGSYLHIASRVSGRAVWRERRTAGGWPGLLGPQLHGLEGKARSPGAWSFVTATATLSTGNPNQPKDKNVLSLISN